MQHRNLEEVLKTCKERLQEYPPEGVEAEFANWRQKLKGPKIIKVCEECDYKLQVEFGITCYNLTGTVIYETKQFITPKWCPCERRNNESQ